MIELTSLKFIKHYINYKLKLYILKIKFKLLLLYMISIENKGRFMIFIENHFY